MKVLLTGNLFHDYEIDIKSGIEELGHNVDMIFNNIHGPFHFRNIKTIPSWLKYGVLPDKFNVNYFIDRSVEHYNKAVQEKIKRGAYDILLVVGGKTISVETLNMFKGRKLFWFLDGLPRYPYIHPKLSCFDDIFVFEPTDVEYVREEFDLTARFLSVAFNPKKFFKKSNSVPQYDFSFVGSYYPKRDEYLSSISDISDNFCIYGDFFRSKTKTLRKRNTKVNAAPAEVNELFNASKININIHHAQSRKGLSPRTFEILGAGGFEIVERQEIGLVFFEGDKHLVFYDSIDEFRDKCNYYLKHDNERTKIAEAGYQIALQNHTWKNRIGEMFNHL
jgi:spore maturation protein CgeB